MLQLKFILAVFLAVLVLGSVAALFALSPAGQATSIFPWAENKCQDLDGGKNYNVSGYVIAPDGSELFDTCISDYQLREYYCSSSGEVRSVDFGCNSSCSDGKCVR